MTHRGTITALILTALLLFGGVGTVAAHSWQTEVAQGPMELGISSTPETPKAGMQTEFAARIADSEYEGDANRTSYGGVTNAEVEVHIRGPDEYHDHVTTQIPEDDAHFHFSYVFPEAGNYSIAVVTELEGQEYAFEFTKQVTLLPARAEGEQMSHLSEEVHSVNEKVGTVESDVQTVDQDVTELNEKVDSLQSQVESLEQTIEEQEATEESNPDLGLLTVMLLVGVAVGGGAVVVTNRD